MADLPNCPFCGGLAHVEFFAKGPNRGDDAICCVNQDCDASSAHINRTTWNRRTPPAGAGEAAGPNRADAIHAGIIASLRGDCNPNGSDYDRRICAALDRAVALLTPAAPTPLPEAVLPCGHPRSLLLVSAETGLPLYCDLCDANSRARDAEATEAEYGAKLRAAEALLPKWRSEAATGRKAADRPGISTEASITMHALVDMMLQLADELDAALRAIGGES